jgi:hypothetical protein
MGLFLSLSHHTPAILRMPTLFMGNLAKKMNPLEDLCSFLAWKMCAGGEQILGCRFSINSVS